MATDLTWRVRRAAARWLFCERRMELVGEEISIATSDGIRQIDVLGLTRLRDGKARELRAIEVKVSRSDLAAGIHKGQISNGPGGIGSAVDYAHLVVVEGVRLDFGELPAAWGVLTARERQPGWGGRGEKPPTIIGIEVTKPAKRLVPTYMVDDDHLTRAIVQAALWRLYDPDTEITVRRYTERHDDHGRIVREIAAQ